MARSKAKKRCEMTAEQLEKARAYYRQYQREYRKRKEADMTPEQLEAVRAYQREYHRQYRANLTPEQREKKRAKAKAYMSSYLQEKADRSKRAKLDAVLAKVGLAGNERKDVSQ